MLPVWLIPGVMKRNQLIKEGKLLQEQLQIAQQTARQASSVAPKAKSLIVPGTIVGAGGILAGKEIADTVNESDSNQARKLSKMPSNYGMGKIQSAEFVLGMLATVENTLASGIHGLRNAQLKKRIAEAQAITDNAKLAIEQANKSLPIKLGAIGLGTAAIATPTFYTLNQRRNSNNAQNL